MLENNYNIKRFRKPFLAGYSLSTDSLLKGAAKEKVSDLQGKLDEKDEQIRALKKELEKHATNAEKYKEKVRKVFIKHDGSEDVRKREVGDVSEMLLVLKDRERKLADEFIALKKVFDGKEKEYQRVISEKDRKIMELEQRLTSEKDLWRQRYSVELAKIMRDGAKAGEMLKKSMFFNVEADMGSWTRDINDIQAEIERLKKMMKEIT
jgi:chromosome segregation ATPase